MQEFITQEIARLQPAKLAGSGLINSPELLTKLMNSLLCLSDVFQYPIGALADLATAVPNAFMGPSEPTSQLLACYILFYQLCLTFRVQPGEFLDADIDIDNAGKPLGFSAVMSMLDPSVLQVLQQHLTVEFVGPACKRLSGTDSISISETWMLLQVLTQFQVPITTDFVATCMDISKQHIKQSSSSSRFVGIWKFAFSHQNHVWIV